MTSLAQLRARHALSEAGLDPRIPLQPASSVTNEVWLAPEVVVRINRQPDQRLRREAALARALPAELGYPTIVGYGGELGADWLIVERRPGQALSRCWPDLSPELRREAIRQLSARLRLLHRTEAPHLATLHQTPQLLDSASSGLRATKRLLDALDEAAKLPHVVPEVIHAAYRRVVETADALEPFDQPTLVHGDLTFENILWDRDHITALLDFEWARTGPADLDLDVILRFCALPKLHVAADYEHRTHPRDYADVPTWLLNDYGKLFTHPRQLTRLRLYAIAWDVRELLLYPPDDIPARLHPQHAWNRLVRTLNADSYLDRPLNARFAAT
jgi:aminoglycoside phosphotransferase